MSFTKMYASVLIDLPLLSIWTGVFNSHSPLCGGGSSFASAHRHFSSFTLDSSTELWGRAFSPGVGPVYAGLSTVSLVLCLPSKTHFYPGTTVGHDFVSVINISPDFSGLRVRVGVEWLINLWPFSDIPIQGAFSIEQSFVKYPSV